MGKMCPGNRRALHLPYLTSMKSVRAANATFHDFSRMYAV
jgi:hypothetical protein